jgi:hypothetical protein
VSQNAPEDEAGAPLELARPYLLPVAPATPTAPAARHRAVVALRSRRRPLVALLATAGLLLAVAAVAAPNGTPETTASLPSARPLSTATPDYGTPPSAAALPTPSEAGSPATAPSAPADPTTAPRPTTGQPVHSPARAATTTSPATQPAAPTTTTAAAQSPAAAPPPLTYTAVTGESCPSAATRGYYRSGWHTDWHSGGGGWGGDGCGGRSVSMPMSGSDSVDDPDNVIVWWFQTGPVTRGACAISVYVPGTGRALDSAGKPAHYMVYGSTSPSGSTIATFKVDQTANQGRWVTGATVTVTGGQLSVRLGSRGIDWGAGRDGAHLGVSALKVSCKAS